MAKGVDLTTEFNGQAGTDIWLDILASSDTIQQDLFHSVADIASDKYTVMKTKADDGFQDYVCEFATENGVILSEASAELKSLQYTNSLCKNDLAKRWSSLSLSGVPGDVPESFDEVVAIMKDIKQKISRKFSQYIWTGNGTVAGQFNGFLTQLTPDTTMAMGTPAEVTAALRAAIDMTSEDVLAQEDVMVVISPELFRIYLRDFQNRNFEQDGHYIDGFKIHTSRDMPNDVILIYNKRNLQILADIVTDEQYIRIIDMAPTTGDDVFRIKANFKAATLIVEPADVTYIKKA